MGESLRVKNRGAPKEQESDYTPYPFDTPLRSSAISQGAAAAAARLGIQRASPITGRACTKERARALERAECPLLLIFNSIISAAVHFDVIRPLGVIPSAWPLNCTAPRRLYGHTCFVKASRGTTRADAAARANFKVDYPILRGAESCACASAAGAPLFCSTAGLQSAAHACSGVCG